jgi:hypothetical protein
VAIPPVEQSGPVVEAFPLAARRPVASGVEAGAAMIGKRVTCSFLHHAGEFPGEIIEVMRHDWLNDAPAVRVKLDRQDAPVSDVLYFADGRDEVKGSLWQCCAPEEAPRAALDKEPTDQA